MKLHSLIHWYSEIQNIQQLIVEQERERYQRVREQYYQKKNPLLIFSNQQSLEMLREWDLYWKKDGCGEELMWIQNKVRINQSNISFFSLSHLFICLFVIVETTNLLSQQSIKMWKRVYWKATKETNWLKKIWTM